LAHSVLLHSGLLTSPAVIRASEDLDLIILRMMRQELNKREELK